MFLSERIKPIPIGNYIDLNAAAANDCDSINMKNYHHVMFNINFQSLGGAAIYVALYSGATDGAKTSALTFWYAFGSAAQGSASCDVLAAYATSAMLTVAHATYDNYMLIIECPATLMDMANEEEWLTLSFLDTDGGATGNVTVNAFGDPRYADNQSITALT